MTLLEPDNRRPTKLRMIRVANNVSISELANRIGLNHGTLSRIERRQLQPSAVTSAKIERFFGTSVEHMLSEVDEAAFALISQN